MRTVLKVGKPNPMYNAVSSHFYSFIFWYNKTKPNITHWTFSVAFPRITSVSTWMLLLHFPAPTVHPTHSAPPPPPPTELLCVVHCVPLHFPWPVAPCGSGLKAPAVIDAPLTLVDSLCWSRYTRRVHSALTCEELPQRCDGRESVSCRHRSAESPRAWCRGQAETVFQSCLEAKKKRCTFEKKRSKLVEMVTNKSGRGGELLFTDSLPWIWFLAGK